MSQLCTYQQLDGTQTSPYRSLSKKILNSVSAKSAAIQIGKAQIMFDWLKKKTIAKVTSDQAAEVVEWTKFLKSADSDNIGLIVAVAAHLRNGWLIDKHMDLLLPHLVIHQDPFVAIELGNRIKMLQKANNQAAACGYFPWLFTVRACFNLALLAETRELWRELERGFPHIISASRGYEEMFNVRLDLERATEFPGGFTPDPL